MNIISWKSLGFISALTLAATCFAQAPLGATGQCKDGSYSMMPSKQGACGKHGGVKEWYENNRAPDKTAATSGSREPAANGTSRTVPSANGGRSTQAAGG